MRIRLLGGENDVEIQNCCSQFRICLDFCLPYVMLLLGYIYVTVDVPVIRSPELGFPHLTLTLFP